MQRQCSSQRERCLSCSSAGWHCWVAALKGQCCLAMPLHNVEWSCKDTWTSLQSKPPLLPAVREAEDLVCYKACFSFAIYGNLFGFPVQKRRDPSSKKCMHWKEYYISTVSMDFLHNKKGPVFSSSLPTSLTGEWAGGLHALMKTIKESLESWKLSLLAQSSCQNWLNFRHPFSCLAQNRKRCVGGGKGCVWESSLFNWDYTWWLLSHGKY